LNKTMNKTLILSASVLMLSIGTAYAVHPPDMKEGLWSVHSQSIDNPGNKTTSGAYTLCRSHAYDQAIRESAKKQKGCAITNESFQSGKYSSAAHCLVANTAVDSKTTTTFSNDTSFHTELHSSYTPALYGVGQMTMIMDQKYLGSCPAGVEPGDRINADGTVIHSGKH